MLKLKQELYEAMFPASIGFINGMLSNIVWFLPWGSFNLWVIYLLIGGCLSGIIASRKRPGNEIFSGIIVGVMSSVGVGVSALIFDRLFRSTVWQYGSSWDDWLATIKIAIMLGIFLAIMFAVPAIGGAWLVRRTREKR